jgi:hypothetical protein
MTMSMVGPYLTTTKYNRKQKASKSKRLAQAQSEHEAWLKKMGVGKTTLPTNAKGQRVGLNEIPDYSTGPRMTSDRIAGSAPVKKDVFYTGNELLGIGTMHKSNAVPIRKDNPEAAKELASMRR